MVYNLYPLKVPKKAALYLKCEAYEFTPNRQYQHCVQSLNTLGHLSITHLKPGVYQGGRELK